MEGRAFEAKAHVSSTELPKVFSRLGNIITIQADDYASSILVANLDVKVDLLCDCPLHSLSGHLLAAYSCISLQQTCISLIMSRRIPGKSHSRRVVLEMLYACPVH